MTPTRPTDRGEVIDFPRLTTLQECGVGFLSWTHAWWCMPHECLIGAATPAICPCGRLRRLFDHPLRLER